MGLRRSEIQSFLEEENIIYNILILTSHFHICKMYIFQYINSDINVVWLQVCYMHLQYRNVNLNMYFLSLDHKPPLVQQMQF